MSCFRFPLGRRVVYTKGGIGSINELFFNVTDASSTADIDNVRASFELLNSTGDLRLLVGYQLSDEPCSGWGAHVALGISTDKLDSNGTKVPDSYTSLANAIKGKLFIRFGFIVVNVANSTRELGEAALRLDFRRC
jgi:hypothetical protein